MPHGAARLGLGTAQLGLDYGITNPLGRVGEGEAGSILAAARQAGITLFDTAHLYGSSEETLGRLLLPDQSALIITKTPKFASASNADDAVMHLQSAFRQSVHRLKRLPHALLFHDCADLFGPSGPKLWDAARELKAAGQVQQVGASIYDGAEVDRLLEHFSPDLVQLPWNPLDPRLNEGGQLERLGASGVEVHGRSLFLQGLLLQNPEQIDARFGTLADAVAELAKAADERKVSRLDVILALAFQEVRIDRFICGVTNAAELDTIALAANRVETLKDFISFAPPQRLDPRVLNPARWSELR